MTIPEALRAVANAYVPGVAAFYCQQNPNPWNRAHEEFARAAESRSWPVIEAAAERFVARCLELVERFKRDGGASSQVDFLDATYLNDQGLTAAWDSVKDKACASCGSKAALKIVPLKSGANRVQLLCKGCAK